MCNMNILPLSGKKLWPRLKFLKIGHISRSWSLGQKLWYGMKGLITRSAHVKYEALPLLVKKLWPRLKFLKSRSYFKVKVTRSKVMVQHERSYHKPYGTTSGKEAMAQVKVLKNRSNFKFKVKVTRSKVMVWHERNAHVKY